MLGLPHSTEVRKPLPKTQLYKQFGWSASQREAFDAVVSRIDFVNWIAPRTLPSIAEGAEVKAITVAEVTLKTRDFDIKPIVLLAKSIPQRFIYVLRFEDYVQLAVYHDKLFVSSWERLDSATVTLNGLNLDAIWQDIVSTIGAFEISHENTLTEQIHIDEERNAILRQIESLERQMRSTNQTHRQRELYSQIKKLKGGLNG